MSTTNGAGTGGPAGGRVVVVGGGVVGAGAVWELARRGVAVTLVDAAHPGRATAAGAGIVAPATSYRAGAAFYPLAFAAAAHYPELLAALAADGVDIGWYGVVGALFVAVDAVEADHLAVVARLLEERRAHGAPNVGDVALVDDRVARTLLPPLGPVAAAVHVSGAARLDGRALERALIAGARRRGAEIVRGRALPVARAGRVVGVRLEDGGEIGADAVILAGGAWSAKFAAALDLELPVRPQRGQIAHLGLAGAATERWPVLLGFHSHYAVAFPGGRLVAGATREDQSGFDARVTAAGVAEVLGQCLRLLPGVAAASLLEVRVGLRPATADHLPILGAVPAWPGLYLATGHGANGLTFGAYSGVLVARVATGAQPGFDLSPYALARFDA